MSLFDKDLLQKCANYSKFRGMLYMKKQSDGTVICTRCLSALTPQPMYTNRNSLFNTTPPAVIPPSFQATKKIKIYIHVYDRNKKVVFYGAHKRIHKHKTKIYI